MTLANQNTAYKDGCSNEKKRRCKYIVLSLIVVGLIVQFIPIKFSIDKTITATAIPLEKLQAGYPVEVAIRGEYEVRWFRGDVFRGSIAIEGYERSPKALEDVFFDPQKGGYGELVYRMPPAPENSPEAERLGKIKMDKAADRLIICIGEPDAAGGTVWGLDGIDPITGGRGTVILYPETDVNDQRIVREIDNPNRDPW